MDGGETRGCVLCACGVTGGRSAARAEQVQTPLSGKAGNPMCVCVSFVPRDGIEGAQIAKDIHMVPSRRPSSVSPSS